MRRQPSTALVLAALCLAACAPRVAAPRGASPGAAPRPPVAQREPKSTTLHGETRVDDYAWLREKGAPRVLANLRAESAHASAVMEPLKPLEERLYREFVGRIKQTDETPPVRDGDYFYYSRTEQGRQYELLARRRGSLQAPEEVLLDLNQLAAQEKFLDLGIFELSDRADLLAYSLDTSGFRDYTLYVKDLTSGTLGPERIAHVSSAAFAADGRTLFYTVEDEAKRPYRLYRHVLGSSEPDTLLLEEKDERFTLGVWRSRSKRFVFVQSSSHTASEMRFIPAAQPEREPQLIAARRDQHEYEVDHGGELFYIRTNDAGRNFRIVTAPIDAPEEANWRELTPHSDTVMLEALQLFSDHMVVHEREDGVPHIRVADLHNGKGQRIALPEPVYEVYPDENPEFSSDRYRFLYQSLTTPRSYYDYDVRQGTLALVKRTEVLGGYDPTRYQAVRIHAQAKDGVLIPVSLVARRDLPPGPRPLLLTGYGAYGYPLATTFSYSRVSLLDRGMVFAIAHVRGGGELGKRWHDQGRMHQKQNTFGDFIAVTEQLIAEGRTSPELLAIEGGSAGGLLIGAVLNQRPELFHAAVLDMPFVDVLNTMSDPSLPLTVGEYEEWGNPAVASQYRDMRAYCPYTNIRAQAYPAILVKTSYNDSQVMYWEPAKYVAKLRATKTDDRPLLFYINMHAGHSGASGRYDALRERAFDLAFVLSELGVEPISLAR